MDNDYIVKKKLVKFYRNIKFKIDYSGMNITTDENGNNKISQMIALPKPFMIARLGAVEMHCVSRWMRNEKYTEREKEQALFAAGIFPNDDKTIEKFCHIYTEALKECDVLGVWEVTDEKRTIKKYCPNAQLIPSRSIESYYYTKPWTMGLGGKKVLIIHPFKKTIEDQFRKRSVLFNQKMVLPEELELETIQAVQSNAGATPPFKDWFDALEAMKEEIKLTDFDVAIIGAGAYGLPLAAYVKSLKKQAIQMSGATQILFGIKGKRWDHHPAISQMYNEYWVRPLPEETPKEIQKVEGGSYW